MQINIPNLFALDASELHVLWSLVGNAIERTDPNFFDDKAAVTMTAPHGAPSRGMDTPVPATQAPPPPDTNTAPPALNAEVDSEGAVWSAKLHSSTKSKTIDGKWKARKPRDATPVPPPVVVPAATNAVSIPPPPTVMVPSSEDPGDTGEPIPLPPGALAGIDFPTFITRITAGMNDGSITQVTISEIQKANGLVSLFSLADTESAKLPAVAAAFGFAQ